MANPSSKACSGAVCTAAECCVNGAYCTFLLLSLGSLSSFTFLSPGCLPEILQLRITLDSRYRSQLQRGRPSSDAVHNIAWSDAKLVHNQSSWAALTDKFVPKLTLKRRNRAPARRILGLCIALDTLYSLDHSWLASGSVPLRPKLALNGSARSMPAIYVDFKPDIVPSEIMHFDNSRFSRFLLEFLRLPNVLEA